MVKVRIKPETRLGKNRVNEHGDTWTVIKEGAHPDTGLDAVVCEADDGYRKWWHKSEIDKEINDG